MAVRLFSLLGIKDQTYAGAWSVPSPARCLAVPCPNNASSHRSPTTQLAHIPVIHSDAPRHNERHSEIPAVTLVSQRHVPEAISALDLNGIANTTAVAPFAPTTAPAAVWASPSQP